MGKSLVLDKTINFALRIIKLYRYLCDEKNEYTLSRQILASGTNIGKHIKEANAGEAKIIFSGETATALRKASETEYWLMLVHQCDFYRRKNA